MRNAGVGSDKRKRHYSIIKYLYLVVQFITRLVTITRRGIIIAVTFWHTCIMPCIHVHGLDYTDVSNNMGVKLDRRVVMMKGLN